jgi:hypothetical protein
VDWSQRSRISHFQTGILRDNEHGVIARGKTSVDHANATQWGHIEAPGGDDRERGCDRSQRDAARRDDDRPV